MADQFDPIFDPLVYTAMRLVYEDSVGASKELKDMVLSAIQARSAASTEEVARSSKPAAEANLAKMTCPKDEAIEIKDDPFDFDDIPTSSISIGSRKPVTAPLAPFSDGCCVCQKLKNDSPDNKRFECTECHRIYHQNCHSPPIRNARLDDPRFVWYCNDCSNAIETTVSYNRPTTAVAKNPTVSSTTEQAQWGSTIFRRTPTSQLQSTAQPAPVIAKEIKLPKRRLPSEDD